MMKKWLSCIAALFGFACSHNNVNNMNVNEFAQSIAAPDVQLLDVRTSEEFRQGHIAGARLLDVNSDDFAQQASQLLDANRPVAVYCRSGRRSAQAAQLLARQGMRVLNLKGGIMAWESQGKPVDTHAASSPCTAGLDVFTTANGTQLVVQPLIHASIRLQVGDKEIHIDPVTKLGGRTTDYTAMAKATHILVTHEHGDHFDRQAISDLTRQGTALVTNRRCADMLGYGLVMSNGDTIRLDDITIEAVPAYNTTPEHLQFHPKGRDNGYIITIDAIRIYVAGDTEDIPEMGHIKDIDIAFLPCNQPYTMTVDQFVKAARTIKPKVLFPYHFSKTDVSTVKDILSADGIEVRLRNFD